MARQQRRQHQAAVETNTFTRHAVKRKIAIAVAVLLVVLAGGGFWYFKRPLTSEQAAAVPEPAPIPVVATTVTSSDVPIYLTGVGTVIAYNTDLVRSQIQGQIT